MLRGFLKKKGSKKKKNEQENKGEKRILTEKGKHIIKAVDQPYEASVKVKGKSRKIMCNYNKLRDTYKYIHTRSKK